jgi:hypothetical protein
MALYTTLRLWLRQMLTAVAQLASTTADTIIDYLLSETVCYYKDAADTAANANTADTYLFRVPTGQAREIVSIYLVTAGTLAADNSNYATITVEKADGAAGSQTTVASLATTEAGGSWAAGTSKALTLSTTKANVLLDAGEVLSFKIDKSGTGVSVPITSLFVEMRKY